MRGLPLLLLSAFPLVTMSDTSLHPAAQIAAAEIAFAKQSVAEGLNTAFAANFAEHVVDFAPRPRENARRFYHDQPNPPVVLDWYPTLTLAAASGGFGISTGPFTVSDTSGRPAQYGHYLSVWKRQQSGDWKVVIDGGVSHPPVSSPALDPATMRPAQLASPAEWRGTDVSALAEADSKFSRIAMSDGLHRAYEAFLANDARMYFEGRVPALGKKAALESAPRGEASFTHQGGGIAVSGDLGYSYGISTHGTHDAQSEGAYLRIWRRDEQGWKIIIERDLPLPPGS